MSAHDQHSKPTDQPEQGDVDGQHPTDEQHDPATEEDTASGGAPQPPA